MPDTRFTRRTLLAIGASLILPAPAVASPEAGEKLIDDIHAHLSFMRALSGPMQDASRLLAENTVRSLVWMEAMVNHPLSFEVIRGHLTLNHAIDFANPQKYPGMPEPQLRSNASYLAILPRFDPRLGYDQPPATAIQHDYLRIKILDALNAIETRGTSPVPKGNQPASRKGVDI